MKIKITSSRITLEGFSNKEVCKICKALGDNKNCPKEKEIKFKDIIGCQKLSPCG